MDSLRCTQNDERSWREAGNRRGFVPFPETFPPFADRVERWHDHDRDPIREDFRKYGRQNVTGRRIITLSHRLPQALDLVAFTYGIKHRHEKAHAVALLVFVEHPAIWSHREKFLYTATFGTDDQGEPICYHRALTRFPLGKIQERLFRQEDVAGNLNVAEEKKISCADGSSFENIKGNVVTIRDPLNDIEDGWDIYKCRFYAHAFLFYPKKAT